MLPLVKHADRFSLRLAAGADEAAVVTAIVDAGSEAERATYCGEVSVGSSRALKLLDFSATGELEAAMSAARGLDGVAFVSHVYSIAESIGSRVYLTDEISIMFQAGLTADRRAALTGAFGLELVTPIVGLADAFTYRVTAEATANPIKLANALDTLPEAIDAWIEAEGESYGR